MSSSFNFVILSFWHKLQHDVSSCCRGTAVTVATASVHDAVPSRCWDLAWVQQVRQKTEVETIGLFWHFIFRHIDNVCVTVPSWRIILPLSSYTSVLWSYSFFFLFIVSFAAPEAQRETVFVCAACNSSLIKLQWDGMSVFSPSDHWEVSHFSPRGPLPSNWNPNTCLGSQVRPLYLSRYLLCLTPRPSTLNQLRPSLHTRNDYGTFTVMCCVLSVSTLNDELGLITQWDLLQSKLKDLVFPLCWAEGRTNCARWRPGLGRWCQVI